MAHLRTSQAFQFLPTVANGTTLHQVNESSCHLAQLYPPTRQRSRIDATADSTLISRNATQRGCSRKLIGFPAFPDLLNSPALKTDHNDDQEGGHGHRSTRRVNLVGIYTALLPCKHQLEIQDEHHRYGTYLLKYYENWVSSNSSQPFFRWLDHGSGRLINVSTSGKEVLRSMLDRSRVQYCTMKERQQYEVVVRNGFLVWANRGGSPSTVDFEPVHTVNTQERWIFVIDLMGRCFLHTKEKGRFHHSSFVSGAPVQAAGRLRADGGKVVEIERYSGHYRTRHAQIQRCIEQFFGSSVVDEEDIALF